MTSLKTACVILVLLGTGLRGQCAYVLTRSPGAGELAAGRIALPNGAYLGGGAPAPGFAKPALHNWYAATIAATGTPLPPVANEGGFAFDALTGIFYATDGLGFLTQDPHSDYAGAAAPAPTATLPLPSGPTGPLTGLAVDPDSGFLWICDAFTFQARSKIHPYPAVTPVMPLPPFVGAPGATGLGFDPATAHLWACNMDGATVEFTTTGIPVSSHPPLPIAHGPIRGLDVNPTNGIGAFPPRPGQTPGFHVCLTDGDHVFDALPPYGSLLAFAGLSSHCRGLAISSDPTLIAGGRDGAGNPRYDNDPVFGGALPTIGLTRTPVFGPLPTPCSVTLDGAAPGTPLRLAADLAPLPLAGVPGGITVGLDVLWLNPLVPSYLSIPLVADGTGHAEFAIPVEVLPAGFQVCVQWLVSDAAAYLGWSFSDALQIVVGLR